MTAYRRTAVVTAFLVIFTATGAIAQNLRMGTRYHIIDKEVLSVTTRYESVDVTTARLADGRIETSLRTKSGAAIGRPLIAQPTPVQLIAQKKGVAAAQETIVLDLHSLDAVNAERYLAWKNGKLGARKLFSEMPSELVGSSGPAVMRAAADDILSVTSVTRDLEAFSRRGGVGTLEGKELPAFTSVLRDNDQKVLAVMAWYAAAKMLIMQTEWDREPLMITAAEFANGWPIEPNMAWANVQMLSLARSRADEIAREGIGAGGGLRPVTLNRPGCDGLRWLDGSVFRQCCDIHDACYYKQDPDCSYTSWWFQGSWSCTQCNIEAILCMGMRLWYCVLYDACIMVSYPIYDWETQEPNCNITYGCVCPAWCWGCNYVLGNDPCPPY